MGTFGYIYMTSENNMLCLHASGFIWKLIVQHDNTME